MFRFTWQSLQNVEYNTNIYLRLEINDMLMSLFYQKGAWHLDFDGEPLEIWRCQKRLGELVLLTIAMWM